MSDLATDTTAAYAAALDAADPLAAHRSEFVGADTSLVYFDGNSLGRPLAVTGERLRAFVEEEWGGRLIRGWDERWYDLPLTLGDEIARVSLGAAPGQTTVGDSTTVLLYKLIRAAVDARPGRSEIVIDSDNFPTDRYIVEGIAAERGLTVRWIEVDRAAGVTLEQVRGAVGERTAVVVLSQVAYRSSHLADVETITPVVQDAGALMVWDLCHSAGSVPVELDRWGVDLAVGCTYKYLNGGPGSPAFAYVAQRHLDGSAGGPALQQPIQGWMGHADPFLMGPGYQPSGGVRRFISGTPAVVGMLAMQDMLALLERTGIDAVRAKSQALTSYAVDLADVWLVEHGVTLASPRDPALRGGHVTLHHERMREVTAALWERDVIPDYRDPGGLRIGLSPLSTSYAEVHAGMSAIRDLLSGT
ncbi:kynureninase [Nocardioides sp. Soil805]|uniref:kynureninase n=1 Tax=Nocardioides sp. Soil805 TaxID=1736416 RepID=UPI000703A1B7|nr:aminotransferase class V-fold PLP-dependent enzyme [Nocardioides sp. Soil805]KRF36491.1 kynureninase [Nocardioides sp. Soil805]